MAEELKGWGLPERKDKKITRNERLRASVEKDESDKLQAQEQQLIGDGERRD